MATVTGNFGITYNFTQALASTVPGSANTGAQIASAYTAKFITSGTSADQVDLAYGTTLTLVASTPQTIDMRSLTDLYGNSITFARVRALFFRNRATTDGYTVTLGNAASNAWTSLLPSTSTMLVYPSSSTNDGWTAIVAPNTTGISTGSSNKSLKIDPGSQNITFDIVALGCSA